MPYLAAATLSASSSRSANRSVSGVRPGETEDARTEAEAWEKAGELGAKAFQSEDAQEGAKAFAEKRAPQWKGR